ncbi:cutinase family protein [Micromonospora echinaurantiaca]|nr:cutinase family protein [Micromonospora echinaurantiaca]
MVLIATLVVVEPVRGSSGNEAECTDYTIVGVRGSGQGYDGPHRMSVPVGPAADHIGQRLASKRVPQSQISYVSLAYPAAPIDWKAVSGGYWRSMEEGVANLVSILNTAAASCPISRTILIGYSQGAQIVHTTLDRQLSESARGAIGAILLISDPIGVNNASYSHYIDNRTGEYLGAYGGGGILGSAQINTQFTSRAVTICLALDLVCSRGSSTDVHGSYAMVGSSVNVLQHYGRSAADKAYVPRPPGSASLEYLDGTLQVFQRSVNGALHHWYYRNNVWINESMGDPINSTPIAVRYNNQLSVFGRSIDNQLLHRFWYGTGWSSTEDLGGSIVGTPAVTAYSDGTLHVLARSGSSALWHWWYRLDTGWSSESFSDGISGDPTVVEYANGLHVFAREGNSLHHRRWNGNGWSKTNLGGVISGDPTAVVYNGQLSVFARGVDNALKHYFTQDDHTWHYQGLPGGYIAGRPSAITYLDGSLQIYARGAEGTLLHWYYFGSWHYEDSGHSIVSDPVAVQYDTQLSVFATASSAPASLLHTWWDGRRWFTEELGESVTAA